MLEPFSFIKGTEKDGMHENKYSVTAVSNS